MFVLKTSIIGC